LAALEKIQLEYNTSQQDKKVSIADLIILGGSAAVEKAAHDAGFNISVPFVAGRVDAYDEHTDVESFEPLEPETDAFRNFTKDQYTVPTEHLMIDKAHLLTLTPPEMTVLLGGLREVYATNDAKEKFVQDFVSAWTKVMNLDLTE